jgi:hypothetical protein
MIRAVIDEIGSNIASILLIHMPKLSLLVPGEYGKGSKILGSDWWGTKSLNEASILTSLPLSSLNSTWWVPSSGNIYLTEKWPEGILIFSNLNNLWPLVTTTLAVRFSICCPVDKFWILNFNSVNVSITGISGS